MKKVNQHIKQIEWWQAKVFALHGPDEMLAPDGWPVPPPKNKHHKGRMQNPQTAKRYTEDEERELHRQQDGY